MNFKKTLAIMLAALMLLPTFIACDNTGDNETKSPESNPTESSNPETDENGETLFDRTSVEDNLPERDFDGKDFRILTIDSMANQYTFNEDLVGDPLNDAMQKRNEDVENRFDAKIVPVLTGGAEAQDIMIQYAQAQMNDEYEVADLIQYMSWVPLVYNMLLDWHQIPNIDLTKPWWNQQSNSEATTKGQLYRLTGDLARSSLELCYVLVFNTELMDDWGYPEEAIYELVFNGEWTLDKMIEMTSEIYLDDGDNVRNAGDTYGHAQCTTTGTDPWITAVDARIMGKDENGNLTVALGTEKVYSTLEKLVNYFYATEGCYGFTGDSAEAGPSFSNGKIGIMSSALRDVQNYAKLNFKYGLLPYPKYDTAQENYLTAAIDWVSVYTVPVTMAESSYDFIGIMMEALNAESYKTVVPAYLDGALKGRYASDPAVAEIMDIIVESRMFDVGYLYGIYIQRLPYLFRYCIRDNNTDLASKLAENESLIEENIEDLMLFFETGEQVWYY